MNVDPRANRSASGLPIGSRIHTWSLFLSVLILVIQSAAVAEISGGGRPLAPGPASASTLSDALLEHFRSRGIFLRRESRHGGQVTEWILEHADVGPQCEAITSFLRFPSGAEVAAMRNHLMMISVPSVLHEQERLAMFYPHARGKTSDKLACQDWFVKSRAITDQILEAFRSYQPAGVGEMPDKNR